MYRTFIGNVTKNKIGFKHNITVCLYTCTTAHSIQHESLRDEGQPPTCQSMYGRLTYRMGILSCEAMLLKGEWSSYLMTQ